MPWPPDPPSASRAGCPSPIRDSGGTSRPGSRLEPWSQSPRCDRQQPWAEASAGHAHSGGTPLGLTVGVRAGQRADQAGWSPAGARLGGVMFEDDANHFVQKVYTFDDGVVPPTMSTGMKRIPQVIAGGEWMRRSSGPQARDPPPRRDARTAFPGGMSFKQFTRGSGPRRTACYAQHSMIPLATSSHAKKSRLSARCTIVLSNMSSNAPDPALSVRYCHRSLP